MTNSIFAVCMWLMIFIFSSAGIAEMPEVSPANSKKDVSVAKPFKVYNPSTEFGQFSRDLDLTPTQQRDIRPLLNDLEEKLLPMKKLTLQRRGKRGAPLVAEQYRKIREKLDSDQRAKFDNMLDRGEITPFVR